MPIIFNRICLNEEMLPTHTHTHTYIYISVSVEFSKTTLLVIQ